MDKLTYQDGYNAAMDDAVRLVRQWSLPALVNVNTAILELQLIASSISALRTRPGVEQAVGDER